MSQLQTLLGHDHPLFVYNLALLERAAGGSGVDTRLIADITEKSNTVLRGLGLDPMDTHPIELYRALNAQVLNGRAAELLRDTAYVLWERDGEVVSLNYQDAVENFHHELAYEELTAESGRRHLRAEIIRRYAEHDRTDNDLVHRLAEEAGLKPERDNGHADVGQLLLASGEVPPLLEESTAEPSSRDDAPYIWAAGDIFTDAFIKLNDDVASSYTDESGNKRLSLPLGTKPPYDRVDIVKAVGPSPNAAVSFARLGLKSGLDSFIGDDQTGQEALDYLASEHVITEDMLVEPGIKTSYYFVLRLGAERTILVKNEQFDYTWQDPKQTPDWIYLALMSDASWQYHEGLADYLERNPEIKLAFQPGTFHFQWGAEKLQRIYHRSEIIVLNREEAVDVTGQSYDDLRALANGLHALGPKIVVITDGPNGSYASFDGRLVTIPNYPDPAPPVDRTGAGDAFASTIVAALALGETMETALTWAPINSMNVVQQLGAQAGLQTRDQIQQWLAKAPADYRVTDLD